MEGERSKDNISFARSPSSVDTSDRQRRLAGSVTKYQPQTLFSGFCPTGNSKERASLTGSLIDPPARASKLKSGLGSQNYEEACPAGDFGDDHSRLNLNLRPTIALMSRWSVPAVAPTPTPKFNSHFGETSRSTTP